jgi:hypothetical protein
MRKEWPARCWSGLVLLGIFAVLVPSVSRSAEIFERVGTVGAQFLTIEPDPRGEALGGAYSALADGPSGVYWNPAGLGFSSGVEVADQWHIADPINWFASLDVSFRAASVSLRTLGDGLPLGTLCLWQGRTDVEPLYLPTEFQQEDAGDELDAWEDAIGISYGHRVIPSLSLGATYKRMRSKFGAIEATGNGFDFGAAFRQGMPINEQAELGVGAAAGVRNLGSLGPYGSSGASWDLPRQAYLSIAPSLRVGHLWDWIAEATVSAELAYDDPEEEWIRMAGIELTVLSGLSARYGTCHKDGSERRNSSGWGLAARYRDIVGLSLDYSTTEFELLGDVERYMLRVAVINCRRGIDVRQVIDAVR